MYIVFGSWPIMESDQQVSSELQQIDWDELDKSKYYILGPSMLLAVRAAVYPSNLVKTRLQVQSSRKPLYDGAFDAFRKIARNEGILGFYKGFGASTLNVVFGNLYISVYEMTRSVLRAKCQVVAALMRNYSPTDKNSVLQVTDTVSNFLGGAAASLVSQTVVVPLDIVSQRLMVSEQLVQQHQMKHPSSASVSSSQNMSSIVRAIYHSEGWRGFYRGYFVSIATYAPSSSIWWGSYGFILPIYFKWLQSCDIDPSWKQGITQFCLKCIWFDLFRSVSTGLQWWHVRRLDSCPHESTGYHPYEEPNLHSIQHNANAEIYSESRRSSWVYDGSRCGTPFILCRFRYSPNFQM